MIDTLSGLDGAGRLLLGEITSLEATIREREADIAVLRERRGRIIESLRAIQSHLTGDVLDAASEILNNTVRPAEYPFRSERVRLILQQVISMPVKAWSAEEVQVALNTNGENVTEKYAANTMRRLHDEGLLVRVSRGLYRASEQLIAIEGLLPEDYD